ncbi:MAG: hypothetical protein JXR70_11285 [Spirochaetales bacterium]|nr:hypothetical protein [Spirochaetales bacterium]
MNIKNRIFRLLNNWPAKLLSLTAAVLLFFFNRMVNREDNNLLVELSVKLRSGYTVSAPYKDKVLVTLMGDREDDVFKITAEDIEVYADLSSEQYAADGKYRVKLSYDKKLPESVTVTLDPLEVDISIEEAIEKSVEISPDFSGVPQEGFRLTFFELSPSLIQLVGPKSRLDKVGSIRTERIDLNGRARDFVVRVRLRSLGDFIEVNGSPIIEVSGKIEDFQVTKEFRDIPLDFTNLNDNFIPEVQQTDAVMVLKSSQGYLDQLSSSDLKLIIDCSRVAYPGKYVLEPSASVGADYQVVSFEPKSLIVDFILKESGGS